MSLTYAQGREKIAERCRHFETNQQEYKAPGIKEAHIRQCLIDPLFEALGWDVRNTAGTAPQYREVIPEDSLEIEGHQKAPDYTFRVGTLAKFFTETKKCGININVDPGPAYQLRRYGWSARVALSILTDFEELGVYDCTSRPKPSDKASHARIQYFQYIEYPDRWREIWDIFSREAVWSGAFDQYASSKKKRGSAQVDDEFLKEIELWRDSLARNIALRNQYLGPDDLNTSVQRAIDRIIFMRMAEDRGIEPYGQLLRLSDQADVYSRFMKLCLKADDKYNSGIFHFHKEDGVTEQHDKLTPALKIDDKIFKPILQSLYFEYGSPYHFGVLPVEILGTVYERFLGKVIRLTPDHRAKVEEKPEVRKAGGVYYTPAYIVDYIVKNTVGKLIEGKSPAQLANGKSDQPLRVLDMACGSGSFLLGAYQLLMDHCLKWYEEHQPEKHKKDVYQDPRRKEWRLTISEKKRILTTHIFGVDIDLQAVEVSKLSLLLKVMEGETDETVGQTRMLFQERALPNLANNIKCGNSLIGPDYITEKLIPDTEELKRVNPFDWSKEFPDAVNAGGFDAVIGNPPYISMLILDKNQVEATKDYWKRKYQSAAGAYDIYVLFIEHALRLVRKNGFVSYIVPNKFLAAEYAIEFRKWLIQNSRFVSLLDLSRVKIWPVSVYPVVPIFCKAGFDPKQKIAVSAAIEESLKDLKQIALVSSARLADVPDNLWSFITQRGADILLKVIRKCTPLERVAEIWGSSTVAEGSEYPRLLLDNGSVRLRPDTARFVVTGAVDRYATTWATDQVQFMHKRYTRPVIRLASPMPVRRVEQARRQKIIISKVALEPRAFPDEHGEFVGAYTTYVFPKTMSLYAMTAIINSSIVRFIYRLLYDALAMAGGYLRFQPPQIRRIPIPDLDPSRPTDKACHDRLVKLVKSMLTLHTQLSSAKGEAEREVLQRLIDSTDREIDSLVYELYELTPAEIAIVEGK